MERHDCTFLLSCQTIEEDALEIEHRHALLRLDVHRHLEQTVRLAHVPFQWGITTTHNDPVVCLLHHLKVICNLGVQGIVGDLEVVLGPELVSGQRSLILASQVCALERVSYRARSELVRVADTLQRVSVTPMPPQTPAQKASTSFPFCSSSLGSICESGTLRTHTSGSTAF